MIAVEPLDQRAQSREVRILLVGVQRNPVVMRQRGQLLADADQAIRVSVRIAIELQLEIPRAGGFLSVGDAALAFYPVVEPNGVPDRDALQPLASGQEARDLLIVQIAP